MSIGTLRYSRLGTKPVWLVTGIYRWLPLVPFVPIVLVRPLRVPQVELIGVGETSTVTAPTNCWHKEKVCSRELALRVTPFDTNWKQGSGATPLTM